MTRNLRESHQSQLGSGRDSAVGTEIGTSMGLTGKAVGEHRWAVHYPDDRDAGRLTPRIDALWEAARSRLVAGRREEAREALSLRRLLVTRAELLAAESRLREVAALESAVDEDLARIEAEVSGPLHGN